MSSRRFGTERVALSFFGDGTTNIGTFHETLNMASTWSAPAVFVIENNLYGEYTPMRQTTPLDDLAERAAAYAMPGVVVDGQDVVAVNEVIGAAIERARRGEGPTLVEAKTYRYSGHSRTDPAKYRPEGELDAWKGRDPIELLGAALLAAGLHREGEKDEIWAQTQREVDESADRAAAEPLTTFEDIRRYVYAG
jgi:pyruvate dehydrogenase E1 component alpha subunit